MDIQKELEAWKLFLKGRILQEEGKDSEALKLIEEALKIESNNPQFLNAKAFLLKSMKRNDEALLNVIKSKYSDLASRITDKNDKPDHWVPGLTGLVKDIESFKARPEDQVTMCW